MRFVLQWVSRNWMIFAPLASATFVLWIYVTHFGFTLTPHQGFGDGKFNSYEAFGQFGDYFGGVLNPFLAFLNIALIAYYQKTSFAKNAEIDALFRLMEIQRNIVDSFQLKSNDMECSGLRTFWVFDDEIKKQYKSGGLDRTHTSEQKLEALVKAYEIFFHESYRKQYLGHYFRHLYHIYKMIDQSTVFSSEEKRRYAKLVRAQLSHLELKLLFLNCCSRDGANFREYVGRYNLLEWFDDTEFDNYDTEFGTSSIIRNKIRGWVEEYGR